MLSLVRRPQLHNLREAPADQVAAVRVDRVGLAVPGDDHPFLKFWIPITMA